MVRVLKIVLIGLVLLVSAIALFEIVVVPWNILVTRDYFWAVSLGSAACVFLCSCAEISISETNESDITKWANKKPPTVLRQGLERYARIVTANRDLFNAVVILANTAILVIYMTILTPAYIDNNNNSDSAILSISQFQINMHIGKADAFTGIGITLALFLLAELIPKQVAIKHGMLSVIGTSWWVILIAIPLILPAYGVATPVRWLLDKLS
jgi:CBS domain containing-hemolysin-like protein